MRNPALLVLVLLACIVTACTPASDVLPPSPPRALDVSNVGGEAWLSPEEFESSESLKTRWAPAWDVWADDQYIMYTPYSAIMGRPAYLDFFMMGDNWNRNIGGQVPLVYGQAYVLNAKTKTWSPIWLNGKYSTKYNSFIELEKKTYDYTYTYYDDDGNQQTETVSEAYFNSPVTTITPEKFSEGDNYIATYICSAMTAVNYRNYKYTYACGCIDDNIESCGRWNIQRLTVNPAPTCGNNRCEQGEDPWSCTQDCLDGPQAPVGLADEEAEGAEFCMLWNVPEDVTCALSATSNEALLSITNNNTQSVRFSNLVVQQSEDAVECSFGDVTIAGGETIVMGATCSPPITSIGSTDFYIVGFITNSDGSGNEMWGYARAELSNYRVDAPTDKDAALLEVKSFLSTASGQQLWIGEGETVMMSVDGKDVEVGIDAIDVNGRIRLVVNGQVDLAVAENQRTNVLDLTTIEVKDVIVREGVQQPPNSVQIQLVNLNSYPGWDVVVSDYLLVGESKTYTANGKQIEVELLQVAGRRASVAVATPDREYAFIMNEEKNSAYGLYDDLGINAVQIYYQGTPDVCPTPAPSSCSGKTVQQYQCFDFGEYGFNTMNWPMLFGGTYTCDETCSNGYCTSNQNSGSMYEGNTQIHSIEGNDYEVTVVAINVSQTRIIVNGEITDWLAAGDSDTLPGVMVTVNSIESGLVSYTLTPTEDVNTVCASIDQGFRFSSFERDANLQFVDVVASENVVILNDIETGTEVQFTYDANGNGEATLGGVNYPFTLTSLGSTDYELCFGNNVVKIFELQEDVVDLDEGETALVSKMNREYYEVTVLFVSDDSTTAKILIEGETTDSLAEGDSDNVGGLAISVVDITGKTVKFLTDDDPTDYIELSTLGGMKVGGETIEDVDVVFMDSTSARYFSLTLSADALQGPDTFMSEGQNFRNQLDEPEGLLGNINIIVDDIKKEVVYGRVIGLGDAEFSLSNGVAITSDVGSISLGNENLEVLSGSALLGENNNDETGLFLFFNDGDAVLRYTYTLTEESIGDVITLAGIEYKIVNVVDSTLKLQQLGTIVTPSVQISSAEPILIDAGASVPAQ